VQEDKVILILGAINTFQALNIHHESLSCSLFPDMIRLTCLVQGLQSRRCLCLFLFFAHATKEKSEPKKESAKEP